MTPSDLRRALVEWQATAPVPPPATMLELMLALDEMLSPGVVLSFEQALAIDATWRQVWATEQRNLAIVDLATRFYPAGGSRNSVALGGTSDIRGTVATLRDKLADLRADMHQASSAAYPSNDVKARFRAEIDQLAEAGKPSVLGGIDHGEGLRWPKAALSLAAFGGQTADGQRTSGGHIAGNAPNTLSLVAWLFKDALIAAVEAEVDALALMSTQSAPAIASGNCVISAPRSSASSASRWRSCLQGAPSTSSATTSTRVPCSASTGRRLKEIITDAVGRKPCPVGRVDGSDGGVISFTPVRRHPPFLGPPAPKTYSGAAERGCALV